MTPGIRSITLCTSVTEIVLYIVQDSGMYRICIIPSAGMYRVHYIVYYYYKCQVEEFKILNFRCLIA